MSYDIHTLARIMDKNFEKVNKKFEEHEKIMNNLNQNMIEQNIERSRQELRAFLSDYYKNINSYHNFLVVAGYAVIFGVWRFERDVIPDEISLIVGVMTLLSASVFTLWQIYFMKIQYRSFERLEEFSRKDFTKMADIQKIQKQFSDLKNETNTDILRAKKIGKLTHHGALWPALFAAGCLAGTFIWRLGQNTL